MMINDYADYNVLSRKTTLSLCSMLYATAKTYINIQKTTLSMTQIR